MGKYAASMIGQQLQQARLSRGLTVAEAAHVLRVKRQMVYKYERGESLPALDVLSRATANWGVIFQIGGCKVIPAGPEQKKPKPSQPIQQGFPFNRPRHYKRASVKIVRRTHEMIITARIRNGA